MKSIVSVLAGILVGFSCAIASAEDGTGTAPMFTASDLRFAPARPRKAAPPTRELVLQPGSTIAKLKRVRALLDGDPQVQMGIAGGAPVLRNPNRTAQVGTYDAVHPISPGAMAIRLRDAKVKENRCKYSVVGGDSSDDRLVEAVLDHFDDVKDNEAQQLIEAEFPEPGDAWVMAAAFPTKRTPPRCEQHYFWILTDGHYIQITYDDGRSQSIMEY